MNSRAFTLSLVIAGIVMMMVHSYMEGYKNNFIREYGENVPVVVAKVDLKEFEVLDDRKVKTIQIPKKFRLPSAFNRIEDIQNTIALTPILKDEQITQPRVSYPGSSTGLSRQVSPTKRGIAITVSEEQAVSKLIKPGDRVDVLARVDYAGGRKDLAKVKTVLQDVLVLSTGLSITNSLPIVLHESKNQLRKQNLNTYTNFNTVTLELDPYQSQKLIFMISVNGAKPFLTLRNNSDKEQVPIQPTRLYDILDSSSQQEARQYFNQRGK